MTPATLTILHSRRGEARPLRRGTGGGRGYRCWCLSDDAPGVHADGGARLPRPWRPATDGFCRLARSTAEGGSMTSHTTKGMLAARALAITIALLGVTVGPGGVASATATRRLTARDMAPG